MTRRSKYGAVRTVVDGITFASKAEARRYQELRLLERAGEVRDLELQPRFPLCAPSLPGHAPVTIATYVGDFAYQTSHGARVVEDVKGVRTPVYRLKRKWVERQYGITITEITR